MKKKKILNNLLEKEKDIVKLCFIFIAKADIDFEIKKKFLALNSIDERMDQLIDIFKSLVPKLEQENSIGGLRTVSLSN